MKRSMFLFALATSLVAAGCNKSDNAVYKPVEVKKASEVSVAAGEEHTLLPLVEGNVWRYDLDNRVLTQVGAVPQKAEIVMEVKKVEDIAGGGKKGTIELSKGEVLQDRQIWRIDTTGIYQEQTGLETVMKLTPPQPAFVFPIEVDKETQWKGTLNEAKGPIALTATIVNRGPDMVDTIPGSFSAYRMETTQQYKDAKGNVIEDKNVSWWVPKIGLVKLKMDKKVGDTMVQSQVLVLKQYTVK